MATDHGWIHRARWSITTFPLVERDGEQQLILDALQRATRARAGSVVLLRGEPGLGKTRLVQVAAAAAGPDMTVVNALGHEVEQSYPFAFIHQVLESLLHSRGGEANDMVRQTSALHRLLERTLNTAGQRASPARSEMIYAFYWFVASLAEERPLLLCLDDLQWSDPDSLEAVRFLAWRLAALPIVIIAGLRPRPAMASAMGERLQLAGKAVFADLHPLSPGGTAALLEHAAASVADADFAAAAHNLTGGNPFLLDQLRLVLHEGGDLPEAGELTSSVSMARPIVLARLSWLPKESVAILQTASVLGEQFQLEQAQELAGLTPCQIRRALAPVLQVGLAGQPDEGSVRFVHPLVRAVLYENIAPAEQRGLHLRVAEILRLHGAGAMVRAPHFAAAAEPGDPAAYSALRQAAAEAWSMAAYDSAAIHLGHAARIAKPGPERAGSYLDLGRAHQRAGSHELAADACKRAAAETCPPEMECRIRQVWALSLALAGHPEDARLQLDLAASAVRNKNPALAAEALAAAVILEVTTRGADTAQELAQEAMRLAPEGSSGPAHLKAVAAMVQVLFLQGDTPNAHRLIEEARRDLGADESSDDLEQVWGWSPRIQFGLIALRTGRYDEATAVMEAQFRRADARRELPARIWSATFLAELEWHRGRLREAFRWCDDALPEDIPWATTQAHVMRGLVLMEMNDHAGAKAALARAAHDARRAGRASGELMWRLGLAMLAARRADPDEAHALFLEILSGPGAQNLACGDFLHLGREAAEACLRAGDRDMAERLTLSMLDLASKADRPTLRAAALRCRGMLAASVGGAAAAEQCFMEALQLHETLGDQLERGRALLAFGSWLRRAGQRKRARGMLTQAGRIFEASGAGYWQQVAEAERLAAGGRRLQRSRRGLLGTLTPQEYRILQLVAQGHSNRQITADLWVSPKTLETHLSHIYSKLEVPTREDLRRLFLTLTEGDATDSEQAE